jgi:hypothetical protein
VAGSDPDYEQSVQAKESTVTSVESKNEQEETSEPKEEKKRKKFSLKCEHEMGKQFSFQPQKSTAASHVKPYCKNCNNSFGYTMFRGTPDDLSYLEAVRAHSDRDEIVGGEYYTVTAVVTLGDYQVTETRIRCKVESGNIIVGFSVKFREGFEESVALLEEGDEITFRGRLYDEGYGFTDCELIVE